MPECAASFELGVSGENIRLQCLQLLLPHLPSSMDTLPFIPNKDQGKKIGKGVEENLGFKELNVGFPGSSLGMNLPTSAGDTGLIPYGSLMDHPLCMPWIN